MTSSCLAAARIASTLLPSSDPRARAHPALSQRRAREAPADEAAAQRWLQERFVARARALFYARLMFLTLGLLILAVPVWRDYFDFSPLAFGGYFFVLLYSVASYLLLGQPRAGRVVTYVTLCLDLLVLVYLVAKPHTGGGLQNPLLGAQLLYTTLFALLFPKPLGILPPLLALPVTVRLDQLLDRSPTAVEVFTVAWYLGLNVIIVYVLIYLDQQEVASHREVVTLQRDLKELAVVEERNRLAREIHDGLGASLSSLIIQAEYAAQLATDEAVRREVIELKASAEEAIEELRRSLKMMREDFDLATGLEDYARTFGERTQLKVAFERRGALSGRLAPEPSLALFRVLQESLSNAARHAQAHQVAVQLDFGEAAVRLTVRDDGQGFDPAVPAPGHYGLVNMQERAHKVGGEVRVESAPGAGALVTFSVPLPAPPSP
jgi:two-component system, NarL family, sensor histidine kinase DegS